MNQDIDLPGLPKDYDALLILYLRSLRELAGWYEESRRQISIQEAHVMVMGSKE